MEITKELSFSARFGGDLVGDLGRNMWTTVTTFKKKAQHLIVGFHEQRSDLLCY